MKFFDVALIAILGSSSLVVSMPAEPSVNPAASNGEKVCLSIRKLSIILLDAKKAVKGLQAAADAAEAVALAQAGDGKISLANC